MLQVIGMMAVLFITFIGGLWIGDKDARHRNANEPNWRNACQVTDANGTLALPAIPEVVAKQ